ncbi:site-specific integrase [Parasphingorhabdus sp.]|uniref:site-specific integrase n=1 Tax=Parasphingorhabdus sp. TaxID=2709688 RepID=UPI003D2C4985
MKKVPGYKHLSQRGQDGVYYYRRYVPPRARGLFEGKHEDVASLETNNILEARHRLLDRETLFEAKLRKIDLAVRMGNDGGQKHKPSIEEIEAEVRVHFTERRNRTSSDRFHDPKFRQQAKDHKLNTEVFLADTERSISLDGDGHTIQAEWSAEAVIAKCNWEIAKGSPEYLRLIRMLSRGHIEAAKQEIQELSGMPIQVIDQTFADARFEADARQKQELVEANSEPLMDLFDAYVTERQPRPRTERAWRRLLTKFVIFLGHNDAKRIRKEDVVAWKDHLLKDRFLSAATINDAYLAALKATLNWAIDNNKLMVSPAHKVSARNQSKIVTREERGLSDEEAILILKATLAPPPPRLTPERVLARRWVPWLCAYSGARVNEVTQMRAEDVSEVDGIWTMLITPEAGSTKNNKTRLIPLHPHILTQGFLKAIASKSGPLFYDPRRRRKPTAENTQASKTGEHLARWVREIGVVDTEVQPNHGWRHRFKTVARRVKMDPETRDFIQSHVPRTEGEGYGNTEIQVKYEAICLLPKYPV